jgi:hypothetical protein
VKLEPAEYTRFMRYTGAFYLGRLQERLGDPKAWMAETDPVNAATAVKAILDSARRQAVDDARTYIMYERQQASN